MEPIVDALFFEEDCDTKPFEYYITERKNYYENPNGFYNFYTTAVPRVSNILKETIHDEGLIEWYKNLDRNRIDLISNNALTVGSIVHESIEKYIKLIQNGIVCEYLNIPYDIMKSKGMRLSDTLITHIKTSFEYFVIWYTTMKSKGHTIEFLDLERSTVNPWYGGTIDAIVKIDDRIYVLDFKTSKRISINYWLQTYAYYWSLSWEYKNLGYGYPNINGLAILRIPKTKNDITQFETIEFDMQEYDNITYLLHQAFVNMVNWYYHKRNIERLLIR